MSCKRNSEEFYSVLNRVAGEFLPSIRKMEPQCVECDSARILSEPP